MKTLDVYAALSVLWLALTGRVQGYFYAPNLASTLPFKGGMAFAQRNQSMILFGGENATTAYTNDLYQLTQTSNGYVWNILPQSNPPPGTTFGEAIYTTQGDSLYLLGGISQTTANQVLPMQVYQYSFESQAWQTLGNGSTNATGGAPNNRQLFSASLDQSGNKVYIFGGALNMTASFNDLWEFDLSTRTFTQLPSFSVAIYGHTSSLLSNGLLVIVGGVVVSNNNGQLTSGLSPMTQLAVFDTKTSVWSVKNATGQIPSTRTSHNAVVVSGDRIVIFGGDNGADMRHRAYLNAVAILDTNSWTWSIPTIQGIPPSRRSYAAAALLDDNHFTVAFGSALNTYYNDINVYAIDSSEWLQTFDTSDSSSSSAISTGIIVGVVIAGVALLAVILFLLWRFQSYIRWLIVRIHSDIWHPRTGEPIWAETARICSQFFLLLLFALCLVFIIRQAVTSPNVTQRIEESAAGVAVPDLRFCFDGFPTYPNPADPRNPDVVCQTDNGYSCSGFVTALNMSIFTPTFADNLGAVNCFLFRSTEDFQMTSTSGANNGSRLLFTFFGDQSVTYGRIHVSAYPKEMDPNAKLYNLNDSIPLLMSDADVLNWKNSERNDIQATNVYTIQPFTYSAMSYDLVYHRYLQPVGWNYVGFLPITNSTPEIETNFRQEAPNPNYTATHSDLGFMAVYPEQFAKITDREVKMYTLLNALGFVGGIFGLLVTLQTWLFGYRPRSPWGVVQRWSVGDMKRSLLRGLSKNFRTTDSGVPFIDPVHHRFSMQNLASLANETETERISRVEERLQVLEMLFKAYYVDDELFRSLDYANKQYSLTDEKPESSTTRQGSSAAAAEPLFMSSPPDEKITTATPAREVKDGFSHLFNKRSDSVESAFSSNSSVEDLHASSRQRLTSDYH